MLSHYQSDLVEAGVDEVGRGCLFGRVYIAAVIWPKEIASPPPYEIKDSKKVTARRRAILRKYIEETAIAYSIAYLDHDEIDRINILAATLEGMHKALDGLTVRPEMIIVDGDRFKKYYDKTTNTFVPHQCFTKGDGKYTSIAAASILAKEARDDWVREMCQNDPSLNKYDLAKNMGYGTAKHLAAIKEHGVSPYHRLSFGICKQFGYVPATATKVTARYKKPTGNVFAMLREKKELIEQKTI